MPEKPMTAVAYTSEHVARVRATCLYVATKLGDLMDDLVVIGGLVPSLLIRAEDLPAGIEAHVGTMDLDLGMTIALLEQHRYRAIAERLRHAGFSQDTNEAGHPTRQRWKIERTSKLTIDFLIPPTLPGDRGGRLRDLEPDFAAIIAPGLELAFRDRRRVTNFGSGVEDVAACLHPLVTDPAANAAVSILRRDFLDHNGIGPRRVAEFLTGRADDSIQADVAGFVGRFLTICEGVRPEER